ncbi:MAG TPA: VIT domain-containing protein [Pyrinomonadaceae bacterium]|nr:VIT domain-containing protein [Pyrinomonadaceae bacterium]
MIEQAQENDSKHRRGFAFNALTLLGGVVMPAISIIVETTTHMCAETFFDPIPTTWHVVMVVFVPLAHLQVWLAVRKGTTQRGTLLGLANAVAVGISLFYTIVYIPLLPLAFIALLYAGMGLLPMAPAFALISGLFLRRQLRRIASPVFAVKMSGLAAGLAFALTLVALVELPITLTRVGLKMAASASPEQRMRGLQWLRAVGNRDYLLRACYERTGEATDLIGYLFSLEDPVTTEEARQIYYRLTGETFNTRIPPQRLKGHWRPQDTFDFDPDQGGRVIAGKVKGLTLAGSRLDGSVDADAGLSYVEWTLTFKNNSAMQQEARAHVQLPPGGVVSRLTLWANGEEREAAFAGRAQVEGAYQQVVRQRRDPVLVTTAGRDRVLVQCFPVPPKGGEMKIRLGIAAPLMLEDRSRGMLRLPYLLERNFRLAEAVTHAVWIESKKPLDAAGNNRLQPEQPGTNIYALRGTFLDEDLSGPSGLVLLARASEINEAWTRDSFKKDGELTRQFIKERNTPSLARIILVVDTSLRMRPHAQAIVAALKTLPSNVETKLLLADGNGAYAEGASQHAVSGSPQEIGGQLERASFEGGADNVPALIKAWELASERPDSSVVVWIHGAQPILLQPLEELRQRFERRPDGSTLYALQTENGSDRIEEKLDGIASIESVPRMNGLQADLERLFGQLSGQRGRMEFVRISEKSQPPANSPNVKETSAHLSRLWANDEVGQLIAAREKDGVDKAMKVATEYQLVTPVSGAVVLETQEQYRQAGLQPVDAGTVPTIPEPEMVMLMAVVMVIFLWMLYRQKMLPRRGARR